MLQSASPPSFQSNDLHCLLSLPNLHVCARKIVVSITKTGFELESLEVELDGTLQVAQLFQGVAKVTVGLGKVGVDANRKAP